MRPHFKGELSELDVIEFPWEKDLRQKLFAEELEKMQEIEKMSEDFFARWDKKKAEKMAKV